MILKRLEDLMLADIEALRTNGVPEGRFIDYKLEAVGGRDEDKREFLADVSAFANASGGDIVLGVRDKEGVAEEIVGVEIDNVDKEKLRLGDIIRSGLEPRLSNFDFRWLQMDGKRGVMVVRVPRSWTAPHRVTLRNHLHFYMRNAAGKHPMNVDELRQAFSLSEGLARRVRHFRAGRVEAVISRDLPFALQDGPKAAIHFVPLSEVADPLAIRFDYGTGIMPPLWASGYSYQHTLEGLCTFSAPHPIRTYSLMFRAGAVECVAGIETHDDRGRRVVALRRVEDYVIEGWQNFRKFAAAYEIQPPFFVFATLLEVKDLAPMVSPFGIVGEPTPSRKEVIQLPEVAVGTDQVGERPEVLFRPLFDVAANAFGLPGSLSYDAHGNYRK
ncbi:AlbA family DNA-binding domain-containing protein [Rhodoblastus sp.]